MSALISGCRKEECMLIKNLVRANVETIMKF